ncbi:MAG: hypothetical protein J3R72DRAFT_86583 [Linnemannia gamsii]|nr:MAG: hypothetical protein J3R72DRAFT_86583 [Linnemannia gamsii]
MTSGLWILRLLIVSFEVDGLELALQVVECVSIFLLSLTGSVIYYYLPISRQLSNLNSRYLWIAFGGASENGEDRLRGQIQKARMDKGKTNTSRWCRVKEGREGMTWARKETNPALKCVQNPETLSWDATTNPRPFSFGDST